MTQVTGEQSRYPSGSFASGQTNGTPDGPRFSLIVPAYNEEHRIGRAIVSYLEAFPDGEVIAVLNGCTDGTEAVLIEIGRRHENLKIIHIDHAVGKGGAVRAGFIAACAPLVGYVDADGATTGNEIRRLFEIIGDDEDGVIASRWMRGSDLRVAQPFLRRLSSRTFNAIVRVLFGMKFTDTQCGAKVFRADALREVSTKIETSNFAFDIDLLYQLQRAGRRIIEVPTVWCDVEGSSVALLRCSGEMLKSTIRLRLRHSLFRYVIPIFDHLWPTKPLHVRGHLKVLFLNWRDPKHPQAGGAEKYLHEIGKRLVAQGHYVSWLTAGYPNSQPDDTIDGISITRVGNRFSVYWMLPLEYLRAFRDRYDVIVDAENGIPFFSPLFSLKPKLCLMHHVHQRVFDRHLPFPVSKIFKWLEAKAMPRIYRDVDFIAVSEDTKREVIELGVPSRCVRVVYNGVDSTTNAHPRAPRPTILYLGRLKKYKRVHRLIEIMPEILRRIPDAELVIAGAGEELNFLQDYVRELGVSTSVRFEGFVSEERKSALLGEAWVFGMPSEMEGWGVTIIEGNAMGTPAIGFAVPGVREAIVDGETGFLADPESPDLLEPLLKILTDTTLRVRLSEAAKRRSEQFSWDRTANDFRDELYRTVTGRNMSFVAEDNVWTIVAERRKERRGVPTTS